MATETNILKLDQTRESIMHNVYSIIDSKIQYLNHQTKGITHPWLEKEADETGVAGEAKSDSVSFEKVEELFLQFEIQSKKKKLLLCLRGLLTESNALIALALLSENNLFAFNEKEIAYILDSGFQRHAA